MDRGRTRFGADPNHVGKSNVFTLVSGSLGFKPQPPLARPKDRALRVPFLYASVVVSVLHPEYKMIFVLFDGRWEWIRFTMLRVC